MSNAYLQTGHGPRKLLMLSGQFGAASDWQTVADALDPDLATCVWFDYRGYGLSRSIAGQFDFDEAAGDALTLLQHLGWNCFGLIGHSMGAMVMQKVLLASADKVDRMMAINPVSAAGVRMDEARLKRFQDSADDVGLRSAVIAGSTAGRLTATACNAIARSSWANSTSSAFRGYLGQWTSLDFAADVRGHPVPVEVLVGEHDPAIHATYAERTWLTHYPNARLQVMGNCGHYPMFETPLALAAAIERTFCPCTT